MRTGDGCVGREPERRISCTCFQQAEADVPPEVLANKDRVSRFGFHSISRA